MALKTDHRERMRDAYEALLTGYAFGTLDEAQSLIVATHLTLSPLARELVAQCEEVGGEMMMGDCSPVSLSGAALERVMAQLDQPEAFEDSCGDGCLCCDFLRRIELPGVLRRYIERDSAFRWKKMFRGFHTYQVPMACEHSVLRLLQVGKGVCSPHHSHGGLEITLVLHGAYSDETGTYRRGDLTVVDGSLDHAPVACPEQGCCCMVVSNAPMRLTGWKRLLNPFLPR